MPLTAPNSPKLDPLPRIEQLLERRYEQLRHWAVMLTRGDSDKAEEVVHDLSVSMMLTRPDLSRVEQIDNYLYKCLRHVYLSHLSRASREALHSVSIVDYDSIQLAFSASHDTDRLAWQNDLRRICNYALWRKSSFKGASFFILRFYHGYYPSEIAELAGLPIATIQARLSQSRSEVQAYMQQPTGLRLQASRNAMPEPVLSWSALPTPELFREMRRTILDARTGECLPERALLARYSSPGRDPVSTSLLSHIVSCERCLGAIDRHFQRPALSDREPLFHGESGSQGRRSSASKPQPGRIAVSQSVQRHCDEIYHHRPRRISIAVDGRIVAAHDLHARESTLSARIDHPDRAEFVEVFSEQHLRIAFLPLGELPPQGPHDQTQQVSLSDGRWMTLSLSFDGQGLNGDVTYFDPALPSDAQGAFKDTEQAVVSLQESSRKSLQAQAEGIGSPTPENKFSGVGDPESGDPESSDTKPGHPQEIGLLPHAVASGGKRLSALLSRLRSRIVRMSLPDMNPTLATAIVFAVASILCFAFWLHRPPRMTGDALLSRAESSDRAARWHNEPGVIRQEVRIKAGPRTLDRAIYRDAQGLRRARRQTLNAQDAQLRDKLSAAGVSWDEPLSAAAYRDWRGRQRVSRDAVTSTQPGLLTLETSVVGAVVKQETLTVRLKDFHPVARTVTLQAGDTVEIAELSYDELPWSASLEDRFDPLAGLSESGLHGSHRPALHLQVPAPLTEMQLDEAELSVRLALTRIDADSRERIELVRKPTGLLVKAIVADEASRNAIDSQLLAIPHVVTAIYTFDEVQKQRPEANRIVDLSTAAVAAQGSPLDKYLIARGMSQENVRQADHDLFDASTVITHEGSAIAELSRRFTNKELLSPGARLTLDTLVGAHKARLLGALADERRILQSTGIAPEALKSQPLGDLKTAGERNASLTEALTASGEQVPDSIEQTVAQTLALLDSMQSLLQHAADPGTTASSRMPAPSSPGKNE